MTDLEMLQEELKGKLRAKDGDLKEIVDKIQGLQSTMPAVSGLETVPSLEYYLQMASDLTKLIRSLIKTQKLSYEKVGKIFRSVDADLSQVCFELFKRFVVYDQGFVKQDTLNFITECVYPAMT